MSLDAILAALLYEPENAHEDSAKSQLLAILTASSSLLFLTYKRQNYENYVTCMYDVDKEKELLNIAP